MKNNTRNLFKEVRKQILCKIETSSKYERKSKNKEKKSSSLLKANKICEKNFLIRSHNTSNSVTSCMNLAKITSYHDDLKACRSLADRIPTEYHISACFHLDGSEKKTHIHTFFMMSHQTRWKLVTYKYILECSLVLFI